MYLIYFIFSYIILYIFIYFMLNIYYIINFVVFSLRIKVGSRFFLQPSWIRGKNFQILTTTLYNYQNDLLKECLLFLGYHCYPSCVEHKFYIIQFIIIATTQPSAAAASSIASSQSTNSPTSAAQFTPTAESTTHDDY